MEDTDDDHERIRTEVLRVFGSTDKADRWLAKPRKRFHGRSAEQLLGDEDGRELVLDELGRLEHGFFA